MFLDNKRPIFAMRLDNKRPIYLPCVPSSDAMPYIYALPTTRLWQKFLERTFFVAEFTETVDSKLLIIYIRSTLYFLVVFFLF
jgi:hypothetical protein